MDEEIERDVNDWVPELPPPTVKAARDANGDYHFLIVGQEVDATTDERYQIVKVASS